MDAEGGQDDADYVCDSCPVLGAGWLAGKYDERRKWNAALKEAKNGKS